jgi:hypothetical protein
VPRSPALTSRTLIALGPERLAELLLERCRLTEAAPLDPATLAEQVFEAFCDNGYGVFDGVIAQLKPVPVPPRQDWQQVGWGSGGPTHAHEREESSRQSTPEQQRLLRIATGIARRPLPAVGFVRIRIQQGPFRLGAGEARLRWRQTGAIVRLPPMPDQSRQALPL